MKWWVSRMEELRVMVVMVVVVVVVVVVSSKYARRRRFDPTAPNTKTGIIRPKEARAL